MVNGKEWRMARNLRRSANFYELQKTVEIKVKGRTGSSPRSEEWHGVRDGAETSNNGRVGGGCEQELRGGSVCSGEGGSG